MEYIFVGAGGILGAIVRYLITVYFTTHNPMSFPIETLAINILGSFLLTFITNILIDEYRLIFYVKLGVTTGFIGAFTTFSTFSMETINMILNGKIFNAFLYIFLSIAGGLFMSYAGFYSADKIFNLIKKMGENYE